MSSRTIKPEEILQQLKARLQRHRTFYPSDVENATLLERHIARVERGEQPLAKRKRPATQDVIPDAAVFMPSYSKFRRNRSAT